MTARRPVETYVHGHAASVLQVHRWRDVANSAAYLVDELVPGRSVLDIGCGPGTITVDMARRVAPGSVTGVDSVESVLDDARAHAASQRVDVEFQVGDCYELDVDDDSVDIVHAHQVLQHVADPVSVLREMHRVCRPGGIVAVREVDYASAVGNPEVTTDWLAVYDTMARRGGFEPNAGRHLVRWARGAGLVDLTAGADCWASRRPKNAPGGARHGPSVSCRRRTRSLPSRRACRTPPTTRQSRGGGGRGWPHPTGGSPLLMAG